MEFATGLSQRLNSFVVTISNQVSNSSLLNRLSSSLSFGDSSRSRSSRSNVKVKTELDEQKVKEKVGKEIEKEAELYFEERYSLGKVLGKGHYAVVKMGTDKATNRTVAIKSIIKKKLTAKDKEGIYQEIEVLSDLNHPSIVKFYNHYETNTKHYIVTEFAAGGELFDRIVERQFYTEIDAKRAIKSICSALKYCHEKGVVHRDLKPENILLKSKYNDTQILIADFGFAKFEERGLNTSLGTPGYIAPEILKGIPRYTSAVDVWSLGVILYILLCGYPPFHSNSRTKLFEKIKTGDYTFHEQYWSEVSFLAKDLVQKMLTVEPLKRYTITHALGHPWLAETLKEGKENDEPKTIDITPALERLKRFQAKRRLRKSQRATQAVVRLLNVTNAKKTGLKLYQLASSRAQLSTRNIIPKRMSSRNINK